MTAKHNLKRCVRRALSRLRDDKLPRRQVKRQLAVLRRHGIIATPPARWGGVMIDIKKLIKIGRPTNDVTLEVWSIDGRSYRWERAQRNKQVGRLIAA